MDVNDAVKLSRRTFLRTAVTALALAGLPFIGRTILIENLRKLERAR